MKENEIRPKDMFDHYLQLCREDASLMDSANFSPVSCQGCLEDQAVSHFVKNDFQYLRCKACGSVYCSPRPGPVVLKMFYLEGKANTYWSEVLFPAVEAARRDKLFKKKAASIKDIVDAKEQYPKTVCDVGAGSGVFLDELRQHYPQAVFFAVEPNQVFADRCRSRDIETIETVVEELEDWQNKFDLVISQEVLEHAYSTLDFVTALCGITKPGGLALVTCLGYEGFDILTLQQHSNSIFPPHHINFLSHKGFKSLFLAAGFSGISILTPGELDTDIVLKSNNCPEFLQVLASRGDDAINDFQQLLRKHGLSSHVWILAEKSV